MTDSPATSFDPCPSPEEEARRAEHLRLARWLQDQPYNQDGADKSWVLHALRRLQRLYASARPLPGRGPDGSLP